MKVLKKNYKLLIGIIIGSIITGTTVYAATVLTSNQVSYDNTSSGLNSTTVKNALDELTEKAKNTNSKNNIVIAYTYDESSCITGDEATCVVTKCYETKTANSCPAGTIIKYRINNNEMKVFYVMYDSGATMTMQQRENTIRNIAWYTEPTDASINDNTKGPTTLLTELERITSTWINVNTINYTMGSTVFYGNAYTYCGEYNSCTSNVYTLSTRSAKARIITVQEAVSLGCTNNNQSCPIWMYNFLQPSTEYGGTVSDYSPVLGNINNDAYWTMNGYGLSNAWIIAREGALFNNHGVSFTSYSGARAIVEINK